MEGSDKSTSASQEQLYELIGDDLANPLPWFNGPWTAAMNAPDTLRQSGELKVIGDRLHNAEAG